MTGEHFAYTDEETTIVDVVNYENLIPGKDYLVKGTLMDKETGKPFVVNGKKVTAEKQFTAKSKAGKVELEFTFDSNALLGKSVIVFEDVYFNDRLIATHIQIRRMSSLECFRLMGFSDGDWKRAKDAGVSDNQLSKQAGNSIVVDVLFYIFEELYEAMPYLFADMRLSSFFSGIGAFEKALLRLMQKVEQQ